MRHRCALLVAALLVGACGEPPQTDTVSITAPAMETISFGMLDGSKVQVKAPVGVVASGATTHTTVSLEGLVLLVETGERSFGEGFLAEMVETESEPYRGGELASGALRSGPNALVWLGDSYSLFLPYERPFYSYEDVRALLDFLAIEEIAEGVVAGADAVELHQITLTVPIEGGGALDIEPTVADQKSMKVDRGASGEVTSIVVTYPTANVIVYVPPGRPGAGFVELMEQVEIHWGS